jgi:cytochrome oxidase assembly protein ShyY1
LRRGLIGPSLVALAAFIILIGLGVWQIERKHWKDALIATLEQRASAAAGPLPPPEQWPRLDQAADEFRRVALTAEIVPGQEALVYTGGSALRSDVSGPGYWVFAPALLPGGGTVVIDRGFVPEGRQEPDTHPTHAGPVAMTGVMRWPEPRGWFTPSDDAPRNLFFARDHRAMAAANGWGEVAPFYLDLETPSGPEILPRYGRINVTLRNEHLQYALTWFGLAAVLAIAFAFWSRGQTTDNR